MRLALVNPPQPHLVEPGQIPSLGLEYLLASVRQHCPWVDSEIVDLSRESIEDARDALLPYDICAYTATSRDYNLVCDLAYRVQDDVASMQVIGGPHVTLTQDRRSVFQSVFKGEGERSIVRFLEDVRDGKPRSEYQAPQVQELDNLPFPLREGPHNGYAHIMGSRGCTHRCTFCASHGLWPGPVRYRSPANVVDELRTLVEKQGLNRFTLYDDNVTGRKQWLREFCRLVEPLKLKWRAQARVTDVTSNVVDMIMRAGCVDLGLGIESFDIDVLKMLAKGVTPQDHARAANAAYEFGLFTRLFMMISTPGETAHYTVNVNRAWLEALEGKYGVVQLYMFMPFPGCAVYEKPESFGVEFISKDMDLFQWYRERPNTQGKMERRLYSPITINGMTRDEQMVNMERMFAFVDGLQRKEGGLAA